VVADAVAILIHETAAVLRLFPRAVPGRIARAVPAAVVADAVAVRVREVVALVRLLSRAVLRVFARAFTLAVVADAIPVRIDAAVAVLNPISVPKLLTIATLLRREERREGERHNRHEEVTNYRLHDPPPLLAGR
jgi:hypothetical protein